MVVASALSMNSDAIARDLFRRGFQPVLLKRRSKVPSEEGWQNLRYCEADVPVVFTNGCNVGILLGEPSDNTVDLDVDHPKGAAALRALGVPATLGYHHAERPHLLFRCEPVPITTKFQGMRAGKLITFMEVRSTGAQSVAPGSIHPDDGRPYEWSNALPRADWNPWDVVSLARDLATVCLLADHWQAPSRGESGARHQLALAVAGFLGRRTDADTVLGIVEAAAHVMQDDEVADRRRAVQDTLLKLSRGIAVVGLPTIASLIGDDDARTLAKWWPAPASSHSTGPPGVNLHTALLEVAREVEAEALPSVWLEPISTLLSQPEEPVDWMVEGLFSVGSSGWVGAEPKVGKSWLVLELVYCLTTGADFLGTFKIPQPRSVIYIQEEDSKQRVLRRFNQLLKGTDGRQWPPDERLRYAIRRGFKLDSAAWTARLRAELEQAPADVVVLDVFQRMHLKSENDQAQMAEVLEVLNALNREFGVAFIVVHHNRKPQPGNEARPNQMLRGSGVLAGWGECSLFARKSKAGKNRFYIVPESKDAPELEEFMVVLEDQPNGGVRLILAETLVQEHIRQDAERFLVVALQLLEEGVDCTAKRVGDQMGVHRTTASRALNYLVEMGKLETDEVIFGKQTVKLYTRPERGEADFL
jgi:hypothetical protein